MYMYVCIFIGYVYKLQSADLLWNVRLLVGMYVSEMRMLSNDAFSSPSGGLMKIVEGSGTKCHIGKSYSFCCLCQIPVGNNLATT